MPAGARLQDLRRRHEEEVPTVVHEKSLVSDEGRWWELANNVQDRFDVINAKTKKFQPRSLETVFDSNLAGMTASVVVKFFFKFSNEDLEPL